MSPSDLSAPNHPGKGGAMAPPLPGAPDSNVPRQPGELVTSSAIVSSSQEADE
ncbi:MAG: hypothetical protein ACKVVP_03245 [Chloroflexota bacterium]